MAAGADAARPEQLGRYGLAADRDTEQTNPGAEAGVRMMQPLRMLQCHS